MADQLLEREYLRALKIIERDQLSVRLPHTHLAELLGSVPPRPGLLRDRQLLRIIQIVTTYEKVLVQNPFPPAPPMQLGSGPITAGYQAWDGARIGVAPDELARHGLILGLTGSAKTSYQWFLALEALKAVPELKLWVFSPKGDGLWWAVREPSCVIIGPRTKMLAPLQRPGFISEGDFLTLFANTWASANYGGQHQKAVTLDTLLRTYKDHPQPSMNDWGQVMQATNNRTLTYSHRDALLWGAARESRFAFAVPGIADAHVGYDLETLFSQHSLFFSIPVFHEGVEWLLLFLLSLLLCYLGQAKHHPPLGHLLLIDEGMLSYRGDDKIGQTPLLSAIHGMIRSFGCGMLITSIARTSMPA